MRFFDYDQRDKKKQRAEKVATCEKRLDSSIRKLFEEDEEQGISICDRNIERVILRDVSTQNSNQPRTMRFNQCVGMDEIEPAPPKHSSACKDSPTSP